MKARQVHYKKWSFSSASKNVKDLNYIIQDKKKEKQKNLSRVCYTCATWQLNQPQAIKGYHTAGFRSAIKWVKTFPQRIVHVQCTSVNCLLLINFRFVKGKAITESLQFVMKNERYQTMQTNKSKVAPGKKAWPDNNWT